LKIHFYKGCFLEEKEESSQKSGLWEGAADFQEQILNLASGEVLEEPFRKATSYLRDGPS